jgi:hypothetical protein
LKSLLERHGRIERSWPIELTDAAGTVHAAFTKTLHLRRRDAATQPGAVARSTAAR